jgi:NADH-quinone oxidoreductase subunit J
MSARVLTYVLMLFMLVSVAHAQPAAPVVKPPPRSATTAGKQVNDRDVFTKHADAGKVPERGKPKSSTGMVVGFWLFAALAVAGSIFVITRKNLIAGVMGMVGTFFAIAALYMMLYAHFLAVIQMLVYAGAIMVLFVFVIMILNRPEDEPVAPSGRAGQAVAGLAIVYLVGRLILILVQVRPTNPAIAMIEPAATPQGHAWGSVRAVGTDLFGPGLFPFEAISILLLVAVVGAIAIARPLHAEDDQPAKTRSEGGVA